MTLCSTIENKQLGTKAGAAFEHAADRPCCSVIDSGQDLSLLSFFFIHTVSLNPKGVVG